MKILLLLLVVAAHSPCWAQSSDNLVLQGRAFLVAKDMPNANARFAAAVAASPNHQAANALYAATRLLSLPYSAPGKELMDRLGVSLTNRNIYNWTAKLPKNKQGQVVPPNNFNAMEFTAFLRSHVLPEIQGALGNHTRASDRNFLLHLSSNETKVSEVTLDYGDIQVFRTFLHGMEFIINTVDSHNFDAQLTALYLMNEEGSLNLENLLTTYTQALTFAKPDDLPGARLAFRNFVDTYVIASDFIRKRPQKTIRLFNYDPTMDTSEGKFRQTVIELKASLDGPVTLTYATNGTQRVQANFGRFLDGSNPIRSLLPEFRENDVLLGSLQDPAFHGVVSGITPSEFYTFFEAQMGVRLLPNFNLHALPTVSLFAVDGRRYSIQGSSDLLRWTELTSRTGAGGTVSFIDPEWTRQVRRFYRAVDMSDFLFFEGTVVDAASGKPIQGAVVGSSFDPQTALTDSEGHFALQTRRSSKTRGPNTLNVKISGYTTAQIYGEIKNGKMAIVELAIRGVGVSGQADITGKVAEFRFDGEGQNYAQPKEPLLAASIRFTTDRAGAPNRSLAVPESGFVGSLDHDYLKGRHQWTWSAWIRSDFPERANQIVYSEDARGNIADVQVSKGQVLVNTWNADVPGNWSSALVSATVIAGKWFHLAVTFDSPSGNLGECPIFVDGQARFVGTLPMVKSFEATANTHAFAIGQNIGSITGGQPSQEFAGAIDDVQIFERALRPDEIPGLLVPRE